MHNMLFGQYGKKRCRSAVRRAAFPESLSYVYKRVERGVLYNVSPVSDVFIYDLYAHLFVRLFKNHFLLRNLPKPWIPPEYLPDMLRYVDRYERVSA